MPGRGTIAPARPDTMTMTDSLVIFLHGVGSRGADLAPLGAAWRTALPHTAFAAPDGPFPFGPGGMGRQWFSVQGVTEANRPQRVADARDAFDAVLKDILAAHGLSDRPDRVALVGFSQGSIMALDAMASGRWPVAAVLAYSGRLASPTPLHPAPGTRTLLIHGDADPIMPVALAAEAESQLKEAGANVRRLILPRLGHTLSAPGVDAGATFLAETLVSAR